MNRRAFVSMSAWTAVASRLPAAEASAFALVARQDRDRILRLAARWLAERPETITSFPSPKSPGGVHDYFSEADYFWPNPANPAGPYKEIDGKSNPDNFLGHRKALIRFSQAMPALTAAFVLTGKPVYARAAAAHLRAWFVAPETRMNPNLQFAQGFHGGPTGRSYGVIDTLQLVEVARAARKLKGSMGASVYAGVVHWFTEYLNWMLSSDFGRKEQAATNNHAIAFALQQAEFSWLANYDPSRSDLRERVLRDVLMPQMAADGSFPRELARTKPFGYSIFAFDCAATLAWSISGADNGAALRMRGENGQSVCRAADFLAPFLADKARWPYPHDVQHWDGWPVRSPGLLFCGLACEKPEYLALWRRLDPDPTDPEVIRNFPVRQPLLWV